MPTISLISDFGTHDASAGIAKGVLLANIPDAGIIDISHEVAPFDTTEAAYLLGAAYRNLPQGTVHLTLVDIFSEAQPKLILSGYAGHYFLTPDNGMLPLALGANPETSWICFELGRENHFTDWLIAAATTINLIQRQNPEDAGLPSFRLKTTQQQKLQAVPGTVSVCQVLYIDQFGNVVTDMTEAKFRQSNVSGRFSLRFMHVNVINSVSRQYTDVPHGNSLARFNSNGFLEICVNQGNAATLFGFRTGGRLNDIKITFE
jgi:S-adenosyl-L-methionine hydrolase (adenosine-forming)